MSDITLRGPASMRWHAERVLAGEYDIAYEKPNPVILDIGANIGAFSIWAALRWPGAVIHCYEPMAENYLMLDINLRDFQDRVEVNWVAVGNPKHTHMFKGKHNCGEASFFQGSEQLEETVEVQTIPPSQLPQADILKLDVEGAEVEILSMLPTIDYDAIMLEYHSEGNRKAVDGLLDDYVLIGGRIDCAHRGVLKYLHKRLVRDL